MSSDVAFLADWNFLGSLGRVTDMHTEAKRAARNARGSVMAI
jgi:hypothetical protein